MENIDVSRSLINDMRNSRELYDLRETMEQKKINIVDESIICFIKSNYSNYLYQGNKKTIDRYIDRIDGLDWTINRSGIEKDFYDKFNCVIAGGRICRAVCNNYYENNSDFDIFMIGKDNVKERINNLVKHILDNNIGKIYLSKNCITIYNDYTIQIILNHYDSIIDIINDFDLGSSMVAYDGKQIYTNAEGLFAYNTGYNIFNLNKIRHSYSSRILKYNDIGFGFLHTNIKKDSTFTIEPTYRTLTDANNAISSVESSGYNSTAKYENNQYIMIKNLTNILKGNNYLCIEVEPEDLKQDIMPVKISKSIHKYFDCPINELTERLEILFTEDEVNSIYIKISKFKGNSTNIMHDIIDSRVNEIIKDKFIEYKIHDGNINRLSNSDDVDLSKFCGDDYVNYDDIKIALK